MQRRNLFLFIGTAWLLSLAVAMPLEGNEPPASEPDNQSGWKAVGYFYSHGQPDAIARSNCMKTEMDAMTCVYNFDAGPDFAIYSIDLMTCLGPRHECEIIDPSFADQKGPAAKSGNKPWESAKWKIEILATKNNKRFRFTAPVRTQRSFMNLTAEINTEVDRRQASGFTVTSVQAYRLFPKAQ